jgi:predicted RNase H-like HicB family nuclease
MVGEEITMIDKLPIIIKPQSNGSYYAECPCVSGCFTQGDTYDEAVESLRDLVADMLATGDAPEVRSAAGNWTISVISVQRPATAPSTCSTRSVRG